MSNDKETYSLAKGLHHLNIAKQYFEDVKMGCVGDNYLKMGTWLSVCRSCHAWIETNPLEAKELGFSESRLNES